MRLWNTVNSLSKIYSQQNMFCSPCSKEPMYLNLAKKKPTNLTKITIYMSRSVNFCIEKKVERETDMNVLMHSRRIVNY